MSQENQKTQMADKNNEYVFDFEKLKVYQEAMQFANEIFSLSSSFNREFQSSIGDQLRRAVLSICNNLAEGSRKPSRARRQFFNYAFDSARECIPMLTLLVKQKQINKEQEEKFRKQCIYICNMIYKLNASLKDLP